MRYHAYHECGGYDEPEWEHYVALEEDCDGCDWQPESDPIRARYHYIEHVHVFTDDELREHDAEVVATYERASIRLDYGV